MEDHSTAALLEKHAQYRYGFTTEVETERIAKGLNEKTIHRISSKKNEPDWMIDFRLKAYQKWLEMPEPHWGHFPYDPIDYQNIIYYSAPKKKPKLGGLEEADPEVLKTFERLGIPIDEQKRLTNVAVDLVFDSVSLHSREIF